MTPEKAFALSFVRVTRGAASWAAIMDGMAAIKAIWEGWSIDERTGYRAAGLDILPGYQMFICYMDTWEDGPDGDIFTGDHWRILYRGAGTSHRVQGVFSKTHSGGVYWSVTIPRSQYQ